MCAHKLSACTHSHNTYSLYAHTVFCLNKCAYTCTHFTRTHTHCALKKIRYFVKVLFLWILSFFHRLHFAAANIGQAQTHKCLQGLYTDNTVRASGGLIKLSCQQILWQISTFICQSVILGIRSCLVQLMYQEKQVWFRGKISISVSFFKRQWHEIQ